jgi:hypothetical protein
MTSHAKRLAIAGAVCAVALLGAWALREPAHRTSYERLVNARGMPLRVVLFAPDPVPAGRTPAVILAQPVNTPTEYGRALTKGLFLSRGFLDYPEGA